MDFLFCHNDKPIDFNCISSISKEIDIKKKNLLYYSALILYLAEKTLDGNTKVQTKMADIRLEVPAENSVLEVLYDGTELYQQ